MGGFIAEKQNRLHLPEKNKQTNKRANKETKTNTPSPPPPQKELNKQRKKQSKNVSDILLPAGIEATPSGFRMDSISQSHCLLAIALSSAILFVLLLSISRLKQYKEFARGIFFCEHPVLLEINLARSHLVYD